MAAAEDEAMIQNMSKMSLQENEDRGCNITIII